MSSLSTFYLLRVTKKKKLKYGFHYTWKGITPKSEIVVVYARDLEEARDKVRVKVRKAFPDTQNASCHWITMPPDFHRISAKVRKSKALYWWKRIRLGLLATILLVIVVLLTSCSVDGFIQCNKNFRKKLTAWEHSRIGDVNIYYLEPIASSPPTRVSPTRSEPKDVKPVESVEGSWESPVFFHP